jgi:hypothetical protein
MTGLEVAIVVLGRRAWGGVVMGAIALLVIAASRLFGG